jgi:gliding motility-associated-like protein
MIVNAQKVILKIKDKAYIFLFIFNLFVVNSFAQKQANFWHFGDGQSLDFSSGNPVQVNGTAINTFEGSTSYADKCGNLLFYSNGGGSQLVFGSESGKIWNANNNVMHDMQYTQGGGWSSAQSSVIIEDPALDSVYFLFTMEDAEDSTSGNGLSYFTVDMRLNGGLGAVVTIDQQVFSNSSEGLCAIRHANKVDYWIIIYNQGVGLNIYSVTASGISLSSTYTGISPITLEAGNIIKASPDGSHLIASFDNGVYVNDKYLFDFNNATGQLSNPIIINPTTTNGFFISSEFSHNSRYLYTVQWDSITPYPLSQSIVQYDLQATNINTSANVIFALTSYGYINGIQIGPDGRIYFVESYSDTLGNIGGRLGRINCPNTTTPSVELNVFQYPNSVFSWLTNFPAWLFQGNSDTYVSLGPDTLSICEACGTIELNALNPGATYLWSTGATSQSINVTAPGTYSVTVNGPCGLGSDQIVIIPCNSCVTVNTSINATACENYTSPWGTIYNQTGIYKDTLITAIGCDSIIELNLTITGLPTLTVSAVSGTCGQPNGTANAIATGGAGNYAFTWSNGATGSIITGLSSGSYSVIATDQNGCSAAAQVIVSTTPASGVILTASDTIIGLNESATLEIVGGDTYNWSPALGLNCTDCPTVIASPQSSTTYTVTGTDSIGCPYIRLVNVVVDIICGELFVPDIFSPNGIGNAENEKLCVYSNCIKSMNLGIYNRWGELIFSTDNQNDCWDGTHKGVPVMTGVYAYRLFVEQFDGEKIEKSGTITITR